MPGRRIKRMGVMHRSRPAAACVNMHQADDKGTWMTLRPRAATVGMLMIWTGIVSRTPCYSAAGLHQHGLICKLRKDQTPSSCSPGWIQLWTPYRPGVAAASAVELSAVTSGSPEVASS